MEIRHEDPTSETARKCRDRYYAELAERFEGGFDPHAKAHAGSPPHTRFVVAWRGGNAVGCGNLVWNERTVGEIKRMWVALDSRGLEIARSILVCLEALARGEGLTAIRLDTNRALNEAQDLYRRSGYSEIARCNGNPYAHTWFEKRL